MKTIFIILIIFFLLFILLFILLFLWCACHLAHICDEQEELLKK